MRKPNRLDTIADAYINAVEDGDFDTILKMWFQAETDKELADMLHELNAELAAD